MFGQQITGQAFQSQYGIIFYQQQGFKSQAFLFGIVGNLVGLVCLVLTWFLVDQVGRRPLLLTGGFLMGVSLYVVGAISTVENPSEDERNAMVASLMMFGASYSLSWAPM